MAAIPSERARAGVLRETSAPRTISVPESGVTAPVTILIRVDLPAPFSPTRAWTSPLRKSNDTPLSAQMPAYDFVIALASSSRGGIGFSAETLPKVRRRQE